MPHETVKDGGPRVDRIRKTQEQLFELRIVHRRIPGRWKQVHQTTRAQNVNVNNRDSIGAAAVSHNPRGGFWPDARQLREFISETDIICRLFEACECRQTGGQVSGALTSKAITARAPAND